MKLTNNSKRERGLPLHDELRVVKPGEEITITAEDEANLRRFPMVNNWLDRGDISITGSAETAKAKAEAKPKAELPHGITGKGYEMPHVGGGWYLAYMNGEPVADRKLRKAEAEEMAKDYGG